ncbi:unnamed protein product, partial [Closterium sp. Yama58-4]
GLRVHERAALLCRGGDLRGGRCLPPQIPRRSDLPWAVGEEDLTHCLELRDLKGRSAMVMPVCAHDG